MSQEQLDAWIDVGGTFTDCYIRLADGRLLRGKTLSSGRVAISCNAWSNQHLLLASELLDDIEDFWIGADLVVINQQGAEHFRRRVTGFTSGEISYEGDLPPDDSDSDRGWQLELDARMEAPVLGVRRLLRVPLSQPLPPLRIRLGTTRGTNALLTRRGARTALCITSPFEDLLRIGDQTRPNLFELSARKTSPLAELTVGIEERLAPDGSVLKELDCQQAQSQLRKVLQAGCSSLAICLMHSYANPEHEQRLRSLAHEVGFAHVRCSTDIAPLIEIVARAQTTVVDAYLSPIIGDYLRDLVVQFGGTVDRVSPLVEKSPNQMQVMTSAGGLVDWREYSGKDSILSGPAGGVAALNAMSNATQIGELIGLDMGGTSTDVCRVTDSQELLYESTKAGVRILTATLPIETVASGGGSICWFDGVSLRVGPQSAGASPGPACYGRCGPLTVTDLNVFLGRIPDEQFPFTLDHMAIERRLDDLLSQAGDSIGMTSRRELADGFRKICTELMAEAVRTVSIAQGADPRAHALVGFGGAAGQHICEIADSLGICLVIDSADGGMLSALGMGLADSRLDAVMPVYRSLPECELPDLELRVQIESDKLCAKLRQYGTPLEDVRTSRKFELRYVGTDTTLTVSWEQNSGFPTEPRSVATQFHAAHQHRFGYRHQGREVELVAVRIACTAAGAHALQPANVLDDNDSQPSPCGAENQPTDGRNTFSLHKRHDCKPGCVLHGPVIVLNEGSTLVIEAGWNAECLTDGTLMLRRSVTDRSLDRQRHVCVTDGALILHRPGETMGENHRLEADATMQQIDSVFRDCLAARLSAIATQMGLVLQQTAISVNVKQRRDFSCAVFDAQGRLLASAPHVPVHLGAMGQTVRSILSEFSRIVRGDSFVTNDPYRGGSHLPDVTVVLPVFASDGTIPEMFVANRAHHADVGGNTPGSMPVGATNLGEEGVVIAPMKLTDAGEDCTAALRSLLERFACPPRNVDENLADIAAQQASCAHGGQLLQQYAAAESWRKLEVYSEHLLSAAQARVMQFVRANFQDDREFVDYLDDGTAIRVSISFRNNGGMRISFAGSGKTSSTNFNANPSIVRAAIMYVLRCLIADDLPLNEGVLRCVNLDIPSGVLNPKPGATPSTTPAVAAGNVETSQRVVDVLLGAFGVAAASQGTMNNLLFGNERFGFYETIGGGAGATSDADGQSAVHTHMTNTRLTDPEILEARYPVQLLRFCIRRDSGGSGRQRGGDGILREMKFLQPLTVSLLTSRRSHYAPFGLEGASAGRIGHNTLIQNGQRLALPGCCQLQVQPGDRLEIQTPGGGGFGKS